MAFPTTGELDNFNRTDSGSLGSNWTEGSFLGLGDNSEIVSNTCRNTGGNNAVMGGYWNPSTFGPDSESFCFLPTVLPDSSGDRFSVACKVHNIGSGTGDGYGLSLRWESNILSYRARRWDNDVDTDLGAEVATAFDAGDGLGLEVIGDQVKGYRHDGISWGSSLITRTDSTYETDSGNVGFTEFEDNLGNAPRLDDFGGGTVVVVGGIIVLRRRMEGE